VRYHVLKGADWCWRWDEILAPPLQGPQTSSVAGEKIRNGMELTELWEVLTRHHSKFLRPNRS